MKNYRLWSRIREALVQKTSELSIDVMMKPRIAIEDQQIPAPDYGQTSSWVAHPELDSPAKLVPEGVASPPVTLRADCFFIHPTTALTKKSWNVPIDDPLAAGLLDHLIAAEAAVFNGSCRVFAPRYRQTCLHPMLRITETGQRAIDLAFDDVCAAFDHYLEHHNEGRPIVIAGHSQGSLHALRLLETRFADKPLRSQLVVAYPVGCQAPMDKLSRTLGSIGLSEAPDETGGLVAWDSLSKPLEPSNIGAPHWYPEGYEAPFGKRAICVNPITWRVDTASSQADSLGALPMPIKEVFERYWKGSRSLPPPPTSLPAPIPGQTRARCQGNSLIVEPPVHPNISPTKGSFHGYDYLLFFMDIRANVAARVEAYFRHREACEIEQQEDDK